MYVVVENSVCNGIVKDGDVAVKWMKWSSRDGSGRMFVEVENSECSGMAKIEAWSRCEWMKRVNIEVGVAVVCGCGLG